MSSTQGTSENASRELLEPFRPESSNLAYHDELTTLYNRRLLSELFTRWWEDLVSRCGEFSLIMMDLDLFKEVNDRYGHLSGDQVLRITASLLRENFRKGDFVFRYGGDEFLVLLPGAGREEAGRLAARARRAMHDYEFLTYEEEKRIEVPLTFSIGVASYPEDGTTPAELISYADALLYDEKRQLRNRSGARRRIIGRILAALVLASIPAFFFLNWDDIVGPQPLQPPADAASPVEVEELGAERMLLLEQVETLERRIEELQQSRDEADPGAGPISSTQGEENEEIETLRARIEQLNQQLQTERLAARPSPPVAPPEPAEPAPVPERTRREPAPVRERSSEQPPPRAVPETITAPSLLQPIKPGYPTIARRLGKEATVELIVRIAPNGKVIHARTVGPRLGFGFEEAAINAALRSSWAPGTRNGDPVEMETGLRVTFRIPD